MLKILQGGGMADVPKLNAREFCLSYPAASINNNCCEDRACSHCGARDNFRLRASVIVRIFDNGTDCSCSGDGDTEYDETDYAACGDCGAEGTWGDFNIPGLDSLLTMTGPNDYENRSDL